MDLDELGFYVYMDEEENKQQNISVSVSSEVADEIRSLQSSLDRGTITQSEFNYRVTKLLNL